MNTTTEETILKFNFCTGTKKSRLREWLKIQDKNSDVNDSCFNEFKKILVKKDMDEYSILLYKYLLSKVDLFDSLDSSHKVIQGAISDENEFRKELTELLQFKLSTLNDEVSSISFQKQKNSMRVTTETMIDAVFTYLLKEFYLRGYNMDSLLLEEAKQEIQNNTDSEWVNEWKAELEYYDFQGNRIKYDDFDDNTSYFNPETGESHTKEDVANQLTTEYAITHTKRRSITLEYLNQEIAKRFSTKKQSGAPVRNQKNYDLAIRLSFICRVDKILEKEIVDISSIPLKNRDCKWIHDCLAFFGVINNYSNSKNTTTPEKFIRQLLKHATLPPNLLMIQRSINLKDQIKSIRST